MNDTVLRSTLRQLQAAVRSRPLWGTFFAIVALFAVTGPYGTGERMAFWPRLAYWSLLQGAGFLITICLVALADAALARVVSSRLARMTAGAAAAAPPIGAVIGGVTQLFFARPVDFAILLDDTLAALPLCLIFCFLSHLTCSYAPAGTPPRKPDAAPGERPDEGPPALMNRLPPPKRGALLRLCVRDHYTEIVTTRGRQLVLLRFADALREIGETPGLRVHRSHWVADAGVAFLAKKAERSYIVMRDGAEIPVSRSYGAAARARFPAQAPAG